MYTFSVGKRKRHGEAARLRAAATAAVTGGYCVDKNGVRSPRLFSLVLHSDIEHVVLEFPISVSREGELHRQ